MNLVLSRRAPLVSLVFLTDVAARPAGAVPILLDIDSTQGGTALTTQEGFVSYHSTDFGNGEGSIEIDGVTLTLFGGIDGNRNRTTGGGGGTYDAVLRDFVFNDGAGAGVGLRIAGLEPGTYNVQSFHYDSGVGIAGNFQIEVRGTNPTLPTTILHDNVPVSTEPYAYQITVAEPGQVIELVFRADDAANRSRLNGIIIDVVPEPSAAGGLLLASAALGLARRRRAR